MSSKSRKDAWIKRVVSILCVMALVITQMPVAFAMTDPATGLTVSTEVVSLNQGWTFTKEGVSQTVNVPHTWNAIDGADGGNNYYKGTCTYVKNIAIPAGYQGKNLVLRFKAVNKLATVYVNGIKVGEHLGGYTAFTVNITNAVNYGKTNEIKVEVNNQENDSMPLSGDFTFYGGIYRDVDLLVQNDTYIYAEDNGSNGVKITSNGSDIIGISADGSTAESAKITVSADVYSSSSSFTPTVNIAGNTYALDKQSLGNNLYTVSKDITLTNVILWNGTKNPYLYTVDVKVASGTVIDTISQKIGIRKFEVDSQKGSFLNGVSYPLRGVNIHQDVKGYGNAVPWVERKKDFDLIKEVGANTIRVAHYPHSDEVYSMADEMGLIVWAEVPLVNNMSDTAGFKANAVQQTRELVAQQYNHPSIVVWGVQNEFVRVGLGGWGSTSNYTAEQSYALRTDMVKTLSDTARAIDATRLITQAIMRDDNRDPSLNWANNGITDVASFNFYYGWYYDKATDLSTNLDAVHAAYPSVPLGMSEYGAGSNTEQHQLADDAFISAWDRSKSRGPFMPEEYQDYIHETAYKAISERPWLWATHIWNMFDFGSDGRNEGGQQGFNNKGLVTFDRQIKKDSFYFYKAQWNKTDKFVYITSRRFIDRKENVTLVKVYSNCDSVTLTVNGKNYGAGTKQQDGVFVWNNVVIQDTGNNVVATGTYDSNKTITDAVSGWTVNQVSGSNIVQNLNDSWTFIKEGQSETINVPHTWNALDGTDGGSNYYKGTCTYVKNIDIPSNYSGKNLVLRFKGANKKAIVYVNGIKVGEHLGGYTAFTVNITSAVKYGQTNEIKVEVNNQENDSMPLSGDFTFYGGIYRDVDLLIQSGMYFYAENNATSGVKITSKGEDVSGISTDGSTAESAKITVSADVYSSSSSFTPTVKIAGNTYALDKQSLGNNLYTVSKDITLTNVTLWNGTKNPYLYTVDVNVASGTQSDTVSQKIGIRKFEIDSQKGTFLNGVFYPLRGVNIHQDKKGFGNAVPWAERKKDFDLIKEVGANTLRVAHYPHADEIYSMADEMGLIVWAEVPLVNNMSDTAEFKANAVQQTRELVAQQYNHPSIVVWGVQNEFVRVNGTDGKTYTAEQNYAMRTDMVKTLSDTARELDKTRLIAQAIMRGTDREPSVDWAKNGITDIASFNFYYGWYYDKAPDLATNLDALHAAYPSVPLGMSEYGAGTNTEQHQLADDAFIAAWDRSKSRGPFMPEEYQNYIHESAWSIISERPWLWATHVWNMFDFGSDGRNEGGQQGFNNKGLVTFDRQIKKDAFYFYKAQWNKADKFVHITSRRYTDRKEAITPVKVYSNCDSVTLTMNGKNYGAGTKQQDGVFVWYNVVLMGENNVVATGTYDGNKTTTDTVTSWTTANALTKPFTITAVGSGLVKEGGITASVDVSPISGIATHTGDEVVLFELMNGSTPVSIVALQKDVNSTDKRLSAFFNVDPSKAAYTVKVFILDRFDNTNTSAPTSLAESLTLN